MMTQRYEIAIEDTAYPEQLRATPRPPRRLYVAGDPEALVRGLAVIGSRKASPYGRECARMFATAAAELGVTVVSGAAIGCDLAAQQGALDAGGSSVAVLGCGADVDYPRSAARILARLRDGEGAVVSEHPWGTAPLPYHFPERNRIIAGLSAAVLVVEAALPSGTFSTADHALDAGRDVFAVPGSVFFPGSAGCNRLIRQGGTPITCRDDLVDSLASVGLVSDAGPGSGSSRQMSAPTDPVHVAALADPGTPDGIAAATGLPVVTVLQRLARLEQSGLLARYADGRYGPCGRG